MLHILKKIIELYLFKIILIIIYNIIYIYFISHDKLYIIMSVLLSFYCIVTIIDENLIIRLSTNVLTIST